MESEDMTATGIGGTAEPVDSGEVHVDLEAEDMTPGNTLYFTRESLPGPEEFSAYERTDLVRATRIHGPFTVRTIDGNEAQCEDGYLAIDSRGYPYPIEKSVFEESYRPASTTPRTGVRQGITTPSGDLGEGGKSLAEDFRGQ